MKIKAAVATRPDAPLEIVGLDLAEPGPGEILVRLLACGIGRADLDAIEGRLQIPLPFVPGSEGVGIVERAGQGVTTLHPGDAVVLTYAFCGTCEACRAHHPRACEQFAARNFAPSRPFLDNPALGGGFFGQSAFATHAVCHASNAIRVPADAPLEVLAALGGDGLIGLAAIIRSLRVQPKQSLAIAGADVIGLAACLTAKARGAAYIVVAEPDARRRTLVVEAGATAVHGIGDLEAAVRCLDAEGADAVLDTTGDSAARRAGLDSLRRNGRLGLAGPRAWRPSEHDGAEDGKSMLDVDRDVAPIDLIPEIVRLLAEGRFPLDRAIDYFAFEHINDALAAARSGSVVKAVVRFPLGSFGDADRAAIEGAVATPPDDGATPTDIERVPVEKVTS